ncbi:MAG: SEC-C metal-binding domain-containing protein [Dehalobacterium formicoaceticum]
MDKYKLIDEKICTGYKLLKDKQTTKACDVMLDAWEDIKTVMDDDAIQDLPTLSSKYKWTEFIMNYVQDLEADLYNAGLDDPKYFSKRIQYCEEMLKISGDSDELLIENTRRAIAESHYALGNKIECDRLFQMWLANDPAWGWGYIGWSACYQFGINNIGPDYRKAEEIISIALSQKNLRDRDDVVDRAIDIYTSLGNDQKAAELKKELKTVSRNTPVSVIKIGRNDPCPCGSGKKYKKCCGK